MSHAPLVVKDPRFEDHEGQPGHPERPERVRAIVRRLEAAADRYVALEPREAADEEILRVHGAEVLATLRALEGQRGQLDPDTYVSPRSLEVARLAAGGTVDLARRIASADGPGGDATTGFALVRPPGHHAERGRSMGFCLLNQVAIAAAALRVEARVERIAIVDFDVHHGNGTQDIFWEDRDTLFVSSHQYPFYPGTGSLAERGAGAGAGSTLNLPMPAGCGDAEYTGVYEAIVLPALVDFSPDMLLVSAGFDAHLADPIANMRLSTAGFACLVRMLRAVADDVCGGRILLALEGGYDLDALVETVLASLDELGGATARSAQTSGGFECASASEPVEGSDILEEMIEVYREVYAPTFPSLR